MTRLILVILVWMMREFIARFRPRFDVSILASDTNNTRSFDSALQCLVSYFHIFQLKFLLILTYSFEHSLFLI